MKRSTPRSLWGVSLSASVITFAAFGCNMILDNNRGVLRTEAETEAGTEPTPTETPDYDSGTSELPPIGIEEDSGTSTPPDAGGCPSGQHLCNGTCVSATDPLYGCGDPKCAPCASAHATSACQGSKCVVAQCDKGYGDCNANPADGCEADLSRAATCGACNAVCPPANPMCAPVGTSFQCTTGCTPTAPLLCGNECVDPTTSVNHCGGCNLKCPDVANATTECKAAQCTFTCKPQYHACANKCVVRTDPTACGPTCAVCPTPANAHPLCTNDACTFQCTTGFADCNLNPADGCEAKLAEDPANCGICGKACASGETCKAGVCTAPPPPPPPPPSDAGPG